MDWWKNLKAEVVDDKLILTIDMKTEPWTSKTGKTELISTTNKPTQIHINGAYYLLHLYLSKKKGGHNVGDKADAT